MGRSYSYHCIGTTAIDAEGRQKAYSAMSRLEILQEAEKARRFDGVEIVEWHAQTRTGARILGTPGTWEDVRADAVPKVKTVQCPICGGVGTKKLSKFEGRLCRVCNGSGITSPGHWEKWQDWQLENMKKGWETE